MTQAEFELMTDLFRLQDQTERAITKMRLMLTPWCDHPFVFISYGTADTMLQTCRVCRASRRGHEAWTKELP